VEDSAGVDDEPSHQVRQTAYKSVTGLPLLHRTFGDEEWVHTRGSVIQRVFIHDPYHCGELNETLGIVGLPQIDLWD
jgi:hypothetical protein